MDIDAKRRTTDGIKLAKLGFNVDFEGDDTRKMTVDLKAPDESVYAGFVFKVKVELEDTYPTKSPVVNFVTPIIHPNIDLSSGFPCHPYLNGSWTHHCELSHIFTTVLPDLLKHPDTDSPYNEDAAYLFRKPKEEYEPVVKKHCATHARRV